MRDWLDSIAARTESQAKYDRSHTYRVGLKLNIRTDADVIRWLQSQASMQGSIKRLIREEIAKQAARGTGSDG